MHTPHPNWIRRWLGFANTAHAATADAASGDALPCRSSPVAALAARAFNALDDGGVDGRAAHGWQRCSFRPEKHPVE
jgi:hypothetical protein